MRLYDDIILQLNSLLNNYSLISLGVGESLSEGDKNQIIFKNEVALELGENNGFGLSGILYTSNSDFINEDEVILLGDDITSLANKSNYARIVLVKIDDSKLGNGNDLYQNLRKIDYTRYHVSPKGIMIRISSMNKKESLLISKDLFKKGISFKNIGSLFIDAYKKNPSVINVKIIFINKEQFDYSTLEKLITRSENVTSALDHLVNKVKMDCHSCSLSKVCEEVEKLCEEDFKN